MNSKCSGRRARGRSSVFPKSTRRSGSRSTTPAPRSSRASFPCSNDCTRRCCQARDLGWRPDRQVTEVRARRLPGIALTHMAPLGSEDGRALGDSPAPRRHSRTERFTVSVVTAIGALAALAVGSALGDIHDHSLHKKLFALFGAIIFLILSV